jgi:hypothetical protein
MSLENMTDEERDSLALLAQKLRDNPKTRPMFLRGVKEVNPDLSVPEVDLENRANQMFGAQQKKIDELNAQLAQTKAEKDAEAQFERLKDAGVLSSRQEWHDLAKYAVENGYQANEAGLARAKAAREAETAPAEPTPHSFMPRLPVENKDLMRDPKGWARTEANKAFDDIIKARRAPAMGGWRPA